MYMHSPRLILRKISRLMSGSGAAEGTHEFSKAEEPPLHDKWNWPLSVVDTTIFSITYVFPVRSGYDKMAQDERDESVSETLLWYTMCDRMCDMPGEPRRES